MWTLYSMKANDAMHWGPYALLTKDHAFKPEEIGNLDYFDICFTEKYFWLFLPPNA